MKIFFNLILFSFFILSPTVVFADTKMEIFADPNFLNPTTKFLAGQQIFIKIESGDGGEKERVVKLKDNQYNDVSTFNLSREGSSPYIYKVSLPAPANSGFYSIEATIASSDSQNKLVKTIQVGTPSTANTKINVRTQVKGTKTKLTPTPPSTLAPTPTDESQNPEIAPEVETATPAAFVTVNFWQKILGFFQNVFKFFFGF